MLDHDSDSAFRFFLSRLHLVLPLVTKVIIMAERPHHYHTYIRLKKKQTWANISALQTFLASDKSRELANMSRILAGATCPILLIEYGHCVPHWRRADIVCSCPRVWRRKKLGNCRHLTIMKGHKAKWGFLSTRLKEVGVRV
ncbi:MAG: hypothetical protein JRN71_08015 [Nitrososphaerota archaeon]|jgi:hypothetical protein|nr:hypothetical protein [Nitrososphaerota archaeon]MDG6980922.1 hypothetical protein [Nitrososphaerota archaeon]MDG6987694.1 hypothetical protein [Nitrososphaerota archaeon]